VSRLEFIRLAYGALKTNGHEAELIKGLTDRIAAGQNRLRRVLAQVRLQQGQSDAALQLELDYITAGNFDPLNTALRRGRVFDSTLKPQEAVREYESALALLQDKALKGNPLNVPDQAEPDDVDRSRQAHPLQPAKQNVLPQLERLYTALGRTNESLAVARQMMSSTGHSYG
jgi:hypothetical protein